MIKFSATSIAVPRSLRLHWLLTLDVTEDLLGWAGLTVRGTDSMGESTDVLLTLIVNPAL